MKTTPRFEAAVSKLYKAFHNGTLHPECCTQCAVGNILDGNTHWKHLSDHHGSLQLNYVGNVHQAFGRRFAGYTPLELLQIEAAFLRGCGYQLPLKQFNFSPSNPYDKDLLFDGLCSVITLLCKLDDISKAPLAIETLLSYNKQQVISEVNL